MIKIKKINSKFLKDLYKNSVNIKKSRKYKGIKYFCLDPIIIDRNEDFFVSKEWFINIIMKLSMKKKITDISILKCLKIMKVL